ncbi:MAG: exo-alpha-sialidase [Rhodospirillaceae bacterium]|nr:exo-alpha-sialidase [Rhodospirillaceae bacterium]
MSKVERIVFGLAPILAFGLASPPLEAADHSRKSVAAAREVCADSALACSDKAQPFFDKDGTLWLVWQGGGRIVVAASRDGVRFSPPVFVTPEAVAADVGPEARPQIVRDAAGVLSVAFTVMQETPGYNGRIYLSRSTDGGQTFSRPAPVTDDPVSQRFPVLAVRKDGRVFAAWLDKRNAGAAKAAYNGAALAFSWLDGASAGPVAIARDNTCECCRFAVAFDASDNVAVLWRQIFPGQVRDHAVMTFAGGRPGPMHRVAADSWRIDACPHHGPAFAIAAGGAYHAAWFTEGDARKGLFYAQSHNAGVTFTAPKPIGNAANNPGHAQLLAVGGDLWLAWQEFDGVRMSIQAMKKTSRGWSPPREIAATDDTSDLPVLIARGSQPYLSWLTAKEGYRLISLEDAP